MNTKTSKSLADTQAIVTAWIGEMKRKHLGFGRALVVGLSGHLGAGKTAFTKLLGKELGIDDEITSPTFVIMKQYLTTDPQWKQLIHIDAYRLEEEGELEILKLEELRKDPGNLIVMEWPENVAYIDNVDELLTFEIKDEVYTIKFG